jgi:large subunit ribosomal protein L25
MEAIELNALVRKETGKGPARRLRSAGLIPAVFYGRGTESIPLSVNSADLLKLMKGRQENVFIKLIINDGSKKRKKLEKLSIMKELQTEPVSRRFFHADFYEISMDHKLTFEVPIHFKGNPVGVGNGGDFQHVKRELKVSCIPTKLPEFIEVDISNLDVGDHLKVSDIQISEDMTILDSREAVIASVSAPKVTIAAVEPVEEEEEKPAEPEVIGRKSAKSESGKD